MDAVEKLARKMCADAGWNPDFRVHAFEPTRIWTPRGAVYLVSGTAPLWLNYKEFAEYAIETVVATVTKKETA